MCKAVYGLGERFYVLAVHYQQKFIKHFKKIKYSGGITF
jgi:hypothetical protein